MPITSDERQSLELPHAATTKSLEMSSVDATTASRMPLAAEHGYNALIAHFDGLAPGNFLRMNRRRSRTATAHPDTILRAPVIPVFRQPMRRIIQNHIPLPDTFSQSPTCSICRSPRRTAVKQPCLPVRNTLLFTVSLTARTNLAACIERFHTSMLPSGTTAANITAAARYRLCTYPCLSRTKKWLEFLPAIFI